MIFKTEQWVWQSPLKPIYGKTQQTIKTILTIFKNFKIVRFVELNIGLEHILWTQNWIQQSTWQHLAHRKGTLCSHCILQVLNLEGFYYSLLRAQHNYYHIAVYPSQTMAITDLVRKCPVSSCLQLDIYPCCGHCPFC